MDNLLPINQIAKLARTDKIHLAYMTKLRLIPQTIRRKINGKITGCYPESVVKQLRQIEELKNRGLTYSQIRYELEETSVSIMSHAGLDPASIYIDSGVRRNDHYAATPNFAIAFLVVGLILGYLLSRQPAPQLMAAKSVTQPAESDYQKVLRLTGNQETSTQPIYVIAVPSQNIDRLGKVNFNELIK